MDKINTNTYDLYRDIKERTKGEIYLGVVGPVRTGKSTFIKRFMELMVIPKMEDPAEKQRTVDELPQSAQGRTIMTTEPKFIPKEGAKISLAEDLSVKVRLVDCVGFLVEGVTGHMEEGSVRMVRTPWSKREVPFAKAAAMGTEKVIKEHATIGIVVTTDGSFTELSRSSYVPAEERTVEELQRQKKPFVILLNTKKPYSEEAVELAKELTDKYKVKVLPVNCDQLKNEDVHRILACVLYEFPVEMVRFDIPKWVEMLKADHPVKKEILYRAGKLLGELKQIKDVMLTDLSWEEESISGIRVLHVDYAKGVATIQIAIREGLYYKTISQLTGEAINSEYELILLLQQLSRIRKEYEKVADAMESVKQTGYGVVMPSLGDIHIEEPELIRHGNRYGVKVKARSTSVHMIRASVETEIAPVIGSEEQALDLTAYIKENQNNEQGLRETAIFGKSMGELLEDGIHRKIKAMDEESQLKLQDTMQKIVNEGNGGFVCIIL